MEFEETSRRRAMMPQRSRRWGDDVEVIFAMDVPDGSEDYVMETAWPLLKGALYSVASAKAVDCAMHIIKYFLKNLGMSELLILLEELQTEQISRLMDHSYELLAQLPSKDWEKQEACENYKKSFEESGGQTMLKKNMRLSNTLVTKGNTLHRSGYCDVATVKSEIQRFEYDTIPLVHLRQSLVDYVVPRFNELVMELGRVTQGHPMVMPPLGMGETFVKCAVQYGSLRKVRSVIRGAVAYETLDKAYAGLERIMHGSELKLSDVFLISIDDRMQKAYTSDGWRDIRLWISVNAHVCEIRLQLLPFLKKRATNVGSDDLMPFLEGTPFGALHLMDDLLYIGSARLDIGICRKALQAKANPNKASDHYGRTALHCAACHGSQELCSILLDPASHGLTSQPQRVCIEDQEGELPFTSAIVRGHFKTAAILLRAACDANQRKSVSLSENAKATCKLTVDDVLDKYTRQSETCRELDSKGTSFVEEVQEKLVEERGKLAQLQILLDLLEEFGFSFHHQNRLSVAVALAVPPLVCALAEKKVRDPQGRTALMLLAEGTGGGELAACTRYLLANLDSDTLEVNATDMNGLTAVDYALDHGAEAIASLLNGSGATDAQGLDLFTRAVRDNNASFVQMLWVDNSRINSSMSETSKSLHVLKSNNIAKVTQCSCFVPKEDCGNGVIRYALTFGDVFPRVKRLMTDSKAPQVLEHFRKHHHQSLDKKAAVNIGQLSGFHGLDIYKGLIPCWVCQSAHRREQIGNSSRHKEESWVGPVSLQLADGAPQLRLFMHHFCAKNLEEMLASETLGHMNALGFDSKQRPWRTVSGAPAATDSRLRPRSAPAGPGGLLRARRFAQGGDSRASTPVGMRRPTTGIRSNVNVKITDHKY